ncbi:MAG: PA2779 family protein [Aquificaceae bacterium]|nr:PA2779 family protein [Aquificaceae bacterium]MCS7196873.1 PA2779 family protein [Aquificaceae bacterium]MCX7989758.1 PA2779 family protein [Aquificaceae bacterium]MDW8032956.1 PA2779 family protein [Aquificaceae bacterium]MDW8294193.1 PA2779 family protein [Aquificaceae bacterium]
MLRLFRKPILAIGVAGWFFTFNTAPTFAGLVGSKPASEILNSKREEELAKVQRALESKEVQEKLRAYGLTKEEVESKLSQLSDQQIHMLAKASDKVLAGGDGVGLAIGVLLVAILIVVLLKLLNKEIIIR